ncbi:TPA: hypothetical protein NQC75_000458 [Klebsiella variicola]|nr:hypothetical protein [Klebsiella variicola]HCI8642893.1 hypothetical protein [Klebsiella variicola]HCI8778955.1 hypothetical protein [Klebsiella variicola]HCI8987997.1 hypothetical protein [Klebsiella variicola]HCI9003342.1 hypothetical protein [Klebsiella variicola]
MDNYVSNDLFEVALSKVSGFEFENFACAFMAVLDGRSFIPMGGVHDGGADGTLDKEMYQTESTNIFYQMTIQADYKAKIKQTVKRLREFSRNPRVIYYVTSKTIPHLDKEEDILSEELGVLVRIRDAKYLYFHINDNQATKSSYYQHLASKTEYLSRVGASTSLGVSDFVKDPSIFVFLQHEISNRKGNIKLIHSITDTLILWALRDTDPDKGIFMAKDEIRDGIIEKFPWSSYFLNGNLSSRLDALKSKSVANREIRWYKNDKKYCLPFQTRESIKLENSADELLALNFLREIQDQCSTMFSLGHKRCQIIADLTKNIIQRVFERQGLMLASFISDSDGSINEKELVISDCIEDILNSSSIKPNDIPDYRNYIEKILNSVFYHSTEIQRQYLLQLSKTFVLLFTLKADPRIVDYFSSMCSKFTLFLGSDIIVKALSERYLSKEDQQCKNLLQSAAISGVKLRMATAVLEEVYTHIRNTNYEFNNHFRSIEPHINKEIARNSSKILIRAYFYAKEAGLIRSWEGFINQFVSYDAISNNLGREELKRYLISEYNLKFIENEELASFSKTSEVKELAETLLENEEKKHDVLAQNSALLVHGIYGLRLKNNESNNGSPFGYGTWWLTNQTRIQKHTSELVRKNSSKYIMRPEFLLNFLSLSPSAEQVRKTYGNLFPNNLGIQFGHRLKEDVFHAVLHKVKEWADYEPGRVTALVSSLSDTLKSEQYNINEESWESIKDKIVI